MQTPIFNPTFVAGLNAILLNQNTNLVVAKEIEISEGIFVNLMTLAVQHGQEEDTNDAIIASKEVFTKDTQGNKVLVSTSVVLGSTTHPNGIEVFSDGKVVISAKNYTSIEDAQNDSSLQVGEIYKCNGFVMYK